jgi:hypothetical protein
MFLSLQPKPRNLSPGLLPAKSFLHIRFLCLYIHFVYAALLLGFKEGLLKKLGERIRQIRIDKGITGATCPFHWQRPAIHTTIRSREYQSIIFLSK